MNVYVLELSRKLGQLGISVDIYTRSQDVVQPHVIEISKNVRLMHIIAGPESPVPKKKLRRFLTKFVVNIASYIKKTGTSYHLIHAHYYLSGLAALKLRELTHNRPLVTSFHTLALMKNLVARDISEREDVTRIQAELLLVKESDRLTAISEVDNAYLRYLYDCPPEKIITVTPGVDADMFHPIDKGKSRRDIHFNTHEKLLLFVGRIEPLKGIDVLMYALKMLRQKNSQLGLRLWIVGGDVSQRRNIWSKELDRLDKLRRQLGLSSVVHFVGRQQQNRLISYYNAADAVIMPSHYESFGITALEAMACGTPVIATNVSGISSLFSSSRRKFISSAANPMSLASQIEVLLTNSHVYASQRRHGLELSKRMTWQKQARKTLKIYETVINSPRYTASS